MKKLIFLAVILAFAFTAEARGGRGYGTGSNPRSHAVKPYIKKDGTYIAPHRATNPNKTKSDNYSAKGNINPYTGKEGGK